MKTKLLPLLIIIVLNVFPNCKLIAKYNDYESMLASFIAMEPVYENLSVVRDGLIVKDAMKLNMQSGAIYYCDELDKRRRAFVYVGSGDFTFKPRIQTERNELNRYFGTDTIDKKIKGFFAFCGDDMTDILHSDNPTQSGRTNRTAQTIASQAKEYLLSLRDDKVWDQVANTLLDGEDNDTFIAFILFEDGTECFYKYSSFDFEETGFYKCEWVPGWHYITKPVAQFKKTFYSPQIDGEGKNNEIEIINHKVKCEIASDLDINAVDSVIAVAQKDNPGWILCNLYYKLNIKNIYLSDGSITQYRIFKERNDLWIKLNENIKKGDTVRFSLEYEGRIFNRNIIKSDTTSLYSEYSNKMENDSRGLPQMLSQSGWYVSSGVNCKPRFDLTFIYFDKLKLACPGKLISKSESGKFKIEKRRVENSAWVSFNIDDYLVNEVSDEGVTPYDFYYYSVTRREETKNRILSSFKFFKDILGPLTSQKICIAESGNSIGMAYSNFIQFPSDNFVGMPDQIKHVNFTPSSISSLWWGGVNSYYSYRDAWLEQALNIYSAFLYYQKIENAPLKLNNFLETAKRNVLNIRSSFAGKGIDPGCLAIGIRNLEFSEKNPDYSIIAQNKGPWVIHMIRRMLTNLDNNLDDSMFIDVLKEFYNRFKGKYYTYQDFKQVLDEKVGGDTQWFFNQWVENYKIPHYTFAYKIEPQASGKYKIRFRITQSNVTPNFRMSIPIRVVYDEKRYSLHRIMMVGEKAEFDMEVKSNPEKVIFNELQAVLCEVENKDYE